MANIYISYANLNRFGTGFAQKVKENFVAKETGKSLIADTEITRLGGIETGAQVNVIEKIKVNGTEQTITDKAVDIAVPTGALASKDKVATADLDTDLAAEVGKIANKVDKVEGKGLSANDYTDDEKTKLSGIAAGAQVNVIESVKVDGTAVAIADKAVNIDLSGKVDKEDGKSLISATDLAQIGTNKSAIETLNADESTTGSVKKQIKDAVDIAVASVYKIKGSVAFASLPTTLVEGNVYNVTDAFTTTDAFVEGAGKAYPAGTNVVAVNVGTKDEPSMKWDCMAGVYDLSIYMKTADYVVATDTEIDAIINGAFAAE